MPVDFLLETSALGIVNQFQLVHVFQSTASKNVSICSGLDDTCTKNPKSVNLNFIYLKCLTATQLLNYHQHRLINIIIGKIAIKTHRLVRHFPCYCGLTPTDFFPINPSELQDETQNYLTYPSKEKVNNPTNNDSLSVDNTRKLFTDALGRRNLSQGRSSAQSVP